MAIDPRLLTYHHIGSTQTVLGRDITLGDHDGKPVLLSGRVESIRLSRSRITLVMWLSIRGRRPTPRVVQALVPIDNG